MNIMSKMKETLLKFKLKRTDFKPNFSNNKSNKKLLFAVLLAILTAMIIVVLIRSVPKEITINEYDGFLKNSLITDALLDEQKVILSVGTKRYYVLKDSIDLNALGKKVAIGVKSEFFSDLMFLALGVLALLLLLGYFKRRQEISQKSAELSAMVEGQGITPTISNVAFKDVAGIDEVKSELIEIVDFLKNPRKYKEFGVSLPRGVLMIGPPGVGKTLVAKAVAGEANVPFFYQSGASFVQIYVGMGAKRVRELFAKAKSYAPSIIFIDEIDAVGKARGGGRNDEREATLNQLLTEMDGFNDNSGVIVIAATNKIEMIDDALLRAGRFDRRIYLTLPDLNDRIAILNRYLSSKNHEANIENIAKHTTGFSGAGLATLVNESAINALRNKRKIITDDDFKAVFSKVLHGKRKLFSLDSKEKEIQAIYQSAKALSAEWFGVDFERISLLEERFISTDKSITSKSEIIANIKVLLSGRAALKIIANESYSNASSDIARARELAKMAIIDYAMSDKIFVGLNDTDEFLDKIDEQTSEFITSIKAQIIALSKYLNEHESVNKEIVKKFLKAEYE